ncbi:MAG: universal stress protein [Betaproteobacteria bacterium]
MYSHILVPIDGSPTSNAGLDEAIKLAQQLGSHLRLLHVVDQMPLAVSAEGFGVMSVDVLGLLKEAGERVLAQGKARVEAAAVPVDTLLIDSPNGRLSDHVTTIARKWPAELIVIGTHGRRGIGRVLMGSDAEQVVRHAPVPVLLYRAAEAGHAAA